MSIGPGDLDAAILRGGTAPAPKMQRTMSGALSLTTSWQRVDYATATLNEFPVVTDAGLHLVDWSSGSKIVTFNDQAAGNHEYMIFLAIEAVTTGVTSPPILPALTVQVRYTIPNGGGPGVDLHFPNHGAASGREYIDFADVLGNGATVAQLPIHVPATAVVRANGVGIDVQLSAAPPAGGAVSLASSVLYLVAT
jgi:hypothetical protein